LSVPFSVSGRCVTEGKADHFRFAAKKGVTYAIETAAAGEPEDGYGAEEIGECLLVMGRDDEARPHFARAADLLGADAWLAEHEADRIARLRRLGEEA
jgi:hypothetical protein